MKITPILMVDAIEPCLDFWVGRLGFTKTVEIPHGSQLGFVILQKGTAELMLQTWASGAADTGESVVDPKKGQISTLYIEVEDFADLRGRMKGAEVVVPERVAFYGMRELFVRDPAGHIIGFAAREASETKDAKAV